MKNKIIFLLVFFWQFSTAQTFELDTIQWAGPSENRINLVILPDGYVESDLSQFVIDANNFTEKLFEESPYKEYKAFFNVITIQVPSNESGASHPGTATDVNEPAHPVSMVDNYFGSSFDRANIHRLLVPTKFAEIFTVLGNNFPTYDQVLILVNTPHYGGSGGTFATTSLNSRSSDIAIHELGHSFARLKDEYYAGDNFASESFNMTQETDPENVKWKNWMGTDGVGIYQHCCSGNSSEWYRPHQSCMMRSLSANFCPVCTERTIETIHGLVEFIDNYNPSNMDPLSSASPLTFNIETVEPNPNTLEIEWVLNGDTINNAESSLSIEQSDLNPGDNKLQVTVRDSTSLLRIDNHDFFHYSTVIWEINNSTVSTSRISSNTLKMRLFPNLPAGVYIVNFIFNDGIIISRKIIKQ